MNTYKKENLGRGITLITQKLENKSSVQFCIGIRAGSRYEDLNNNGVSHLVEHLVSRNIGELLRKNGWQESYILSTFDAFTNREFTKYYFEAEKSDLPLALEVISQVLLPKIDEASLKLEKDIILEEIAESADDPLSAFENSVSKNFFDNNSLSLPTLGTADNIKKLTFEQITKYIYEFYTPSRILVVATGNIDADDLSKPLTKSSVNSNTANKEITFEHFSPPKTGETRLVGFTSQTMVGWYFVSETTDAAESVRATFFTRVLDEYLNYHIRDNGVSYSFSASIARFQDVGVLQIYSSFSDEKITGFTALVRQYLDSFRVDLDKEALSNSKENILKVLKTENSEADGLGDYLLDSYLQFGEVISIDDVMELIKKISINDFEDYYCQYLSNPGHLFISKS